MKNVPAETLRHNIKYLDLLSRSFPNVTAAVEEVVNLKAILNLPKGTEHFLTDIHGEAEAFNHVMQNASGAIRRKVSEELSSTVSIDDLEELTTLIYYPKEKLELIKAEKKGQYYKLVRAHHLSVGTGGAGNCFEVHAVKGEETATEKFCLHNGRAAAGG